MWFNKNGQENDVAISTRIRLARNIASMPFPSRLTDDKAKQIQEKIKQAAGDGFEFLNLDNAPKLNKLSLVEEHTISREMLNGKNKALLIGKDGEESIMIGEEDHIRLQVIVPGFDIERAYKKADALDDKLSEKLDYAYDSQFGFLTHCPTNVGTALRASVMLHLPALRMGGAINRLVGEVGKLGLTIRGLYGEGSEAKGDLYQISNQITLGISESQTIEKLKTVALQIIASEREMRKKLAQNSGDKLADALWRALGTLRYARTLSSSECESLLSQVRLGINMDIIKGVDIDAITALMINAEPAHVSLGAGRELSASERDKARADMIRDKLKD